ncbi:CRISPR-associated endonuclease Cas2 [Methanococcus aeolicus]|uniref:CRISPR-associated endonuclease Cas2 n=1 Tax=Methanococcus aeolicus TaxID=42879 RepID=UPI0021C7F78B|nr:CRISPR-associated endonuclease Cas2 [Methanococcus aeolicus]UXM84654.1 CRISPR-associated endonuclease Cas2 [Methanococcus aeolicus]
MIYVIYDISDNKIRKKISDKCLNYGLYRIQKSVFAGSLNNNRVDELRVFCENIFKEGGENDKIYIIPVCKKCFGSLICVGEEFDKDLITDNKNTLVL